MTCGNCNDAPLIPGEVDSSTGIFQPDPVVEVPDGLVNDEAVVAVNPVVTPGTVTATCPPAPSNCPRCHRCSADCQCCAPAWTPPTINLVEPVPQKAVCVLPSGCSDTSPFFISNISQFIVPACGKETAIYTKCAKQLYPGAVLALSPSGLILHVTLVGDGFVMAQNDCESCNIKSPGEPILANSIFGVNGPSCSPSGGSSDNCATFLAADFTTPAIGSTAPLKVGGALTGFSVGAKIRLGDKFFILNAINGLVFTALNSSEGGVVGETTYYDANSDGIPDVCVTLAEGVSPCENELTCGNIIGCAGDGTQGHFTGRKKGDVLSWDGTCFRNYNLPSSLVDCTPLINCLVLDPASDPTTTYLVTVGDSTIFTNPDLDGFSPLVLRIDGDKFILDSIIDATHIRVIPDFVVTEMKTYGGMCGVDSLVCIGDCCDRVSSELTALASWNPIATINGSAVISNEAIQQANFSIVGPWVMFKLNKSLTLASAGTGSGSTILSLAPPPVAGPGESVDAYLAALAFNNVVVSSGTAAAGAAGSITLVSPAPAIAEAYTRMVISLTGGTGSGQIREIAGYSSGRVALPSVNFATPPDNTSIYEISYGTLPRGYWRYATTNKIIVFQEGNLEFANGDIAISIDGKYSRV